MQKYILSLVTIVFIMPMFYSDISYAHSSSNHSTSVCPDFPRDEWNVTISARLTGKPQCFYTKKIVGEHYVVSSMQIILSRLLKLIFLVAVFGVLKKKRIS